MSSNSFKIELVFVGGSLLTAEQRRVFRSAAKRWEQVIQGTASGLDLVLRISAQSISIDGPGRVLGRAGPTTIRPNDNLPVQGIMEFDAADLHDMQRGGTLQAIILHEMGHVLGIGTLWQSKGLLRGSGTNNPEYVGANAMREYAALRNTNVQRRNNNVTPIPVANTGGPGTAEGHWREAVFEEELMTGYAENAGTAMPISRMTIAALQDLGYTVRYAAADPYKLPYRPPSKAISKSSHHWRAHRHYCKAKFPRMQMEKATVIRRRRWCCCFLMLLLIIAMVTLVMLLLFGCDFSFVEQILETLDIDEMVCQE